MNAARTLFTAFLALLAGCANPLLHERQPENEVLAFDGAAFGDRPDIIAVHDIYRLSNEQETAFRQYFDNPTWQDTPAHERVWAYLQDVTTGFDYQGETYTAEEALRRSSGNCLSLAVLTTALADLAGVDTVYHLVDSAPVFESHGQVVFKARHVRTKLLSPERTEAQQADQVVAGSNLVIRGGLLVDYFPHAGNRFIGNIRKQQYQAMFYNNLAGEAIARGDYNRAFWLLREALVLKPDDTAAINAMAIALQYAPYLHEGYAGLGKAYYMIGDLERAEAGFQKALHYSGRASTRSMYEAKLMALGHIP